MDGVRYYITLLMGFKMNDVKQNITRKNIVKLCALSSASLKAHQDVADTLRKLAWTMARQYLVFQEEDVDVLLKPKLKNEIIQMRKVMQGASSQDPEAFIQKVITTGRRPDADYGMMHRSVPVSAELMAILTKLSVENLKDTKEVVKETTAKRGM